MGRTHGRVLVLAPITVYAASRTDLIVAHAEIFARPPEFRWIRRNYAAKPTRIRVTPALTDTRPPGFGGSAKSLTPRS